MGRYCAHHAVQFAKPEVVIEFDSDPSQGRETRKKLLLKPHATSSG